MYEEKSFENLCQDKDFLQKVITQKNENDVRNLFNENGINITQQQLNFLKEILHILFRKKQKLSMVELNKISGGTLSSQGVCQIYKAFMEALLLLIRSHVENSDPTGALKGIRWMEEVPGDPNNLSWARVARNAVNGTLALSPQLNETVNSIATNASLWWK